MLSAEQLALRMQGLGSSEIGAVAGLYPPTPAWPTSHTVWLKKRRLVDDEPQGLSAKIGDITEELSAQLYAEQFNATLEKSTTLIHPDLPWVVGTPDRLIVGATGSTELLDALATISPRRPHWRRLLEIKWVGWRVADHWDPQKDDGVPDYVRAQCEWLMLLTGLKQCDVAAILGGEEFHVWRFEAHPAVAARLLEIGEKFWRENVIGGAPPPVDGTERAREMLEVLFKQTRGDYLRAPELAEAWIDKLIDANAAIARAKREKLEAENHLRVEIGEHDGLISRRGKAHNKVASGHTRRSFKFFESKASKAARAASPTEDNDTAEETAA